MIDSDDVTAAWPLSEITAAQINRLRRRAGMSRDQLAARCRDLGAPEQMTAAAIANIETGRRNPTTGRRRRDVTIDELGIFAAALGVPPVLLAIPVGLRELVEILPGRVVSAWDAAQWFTGEEPLPTHNDAGERFVTSDAFRAWETGGAPLDFYRRQDELLDDWRSADAAARPDLEQRLAELRRSMRRAGVRTGALPGQLTANLAHVDSDEESGNG
ncbi:helix-turn-helix domain-containing protein [Pseudonocardia parietis]|uniref:Transcriptional regulator with XRE-family HTH domain n=1 Tax=Pseudonocardia parietis TaxID=570936 RepID=A0ABS4W3D1_9PSEU|nr:helix-turn-helix transcriptional regulator [Pseudonocardia parietis]MBP2370696.1 transcriptional regulator with XRE-family HTH domain [Pseudonocardia parietis]